MTTSASVLRSEIIAAVRGATVATAAGLSTGVWSSTSVPHVFDGAREGFIGGRNRGRCPFLEVEIGPQDFDSTTIDGGMLTTTVRIRVHETTRNGETALHAIMVAALAAIRATPTQRYTAQGDDQIGATVKGPMGWMLEAAVTVVQSFNRTTYEGA